MSYSHALVPLFSLPHVEDCHKRLRVLFGGEYIVDTKKAKLVYVFFICRLGGLLTFSRWLKPHYPIFFFESSHLFDKYLAEAVEYTEDESQYQTFDIVVGDRKALGAATKYVKGELKGLVTISFGAMDAWFEEDEQVFIHPKDPYKARIDLIQLHRLLERLQG